MTESINAHTIEFTFVGTGSATSNDVSVNTVSSLSLDGKLIGIDHTQDLISTYTGLPLGATGLLSYDGHNNDFWYRATAPNADVYDLFSVFGNGSSVFPLQAFDINPNLITVSATQYANANTVSVGYLLTNTDTGKATISAVPLPAPFFMFVSGLLGMVGLRKKATQA
jgi:hypothetical protein